MVLQKRLNYGFNSYQVPPTPRAPRSARKRSIRRIKVDESQMCAFDLLATIAGNLLLEGKSSPSPMDMVNGQKQSEAVKDSFEEEKHSEDNDLSAKFCKDGSCDQNFIVSELVLQAPSLNDCSKELPHTQNDACSGPASVITTDCSEKVGSAEHLANGEIRDGNGSCSGKTDIELFGCRVSPGCKLEDESRKHIKVEPNDLKLPVSTRDDVCTSECPLAWDRKPFGLGNSDDSVKFSMSSDHIPSVSLPFNRENIKLVTRDDDEKSSGCTQPSTRNKAFRPSPRVGDRKIRKILLSKYWKVAPRLKDKKYFSADAEIKHGFHNVKNGNKRQRSQRDYPFKKRKLYDCTSISNSDGGICSDGTCQSPQKGCSGYTSASMLPRVTGTSRAVGEHASLQSKNSPVKLKIKSFRIPEFFIEIPETATVGSLKKTVMEAVTGLLSGGLHVGVLLQGKKIRDDNKTLLQTVISHDSKLDALGFILEPNTSQAPQPLNPEDLPFLLPCDAPEPLSRYPPASVTSHSAVVRGTSDALTDPPVTNFNNFIESDHDSAPSPPHVSEKSNVDSRALVAVPAMNMEALTVVPMRKSKRSEAAQRRIRRPFSVFEVEALVQAVEKLGTGRWRDVKLRAFDNAKHRTYVDLKDKWKTLVHTARISPQQRRGEPVPQELLDRVLTAHAYWSQQQVKLQYKQQSQTCHLL